MFCFVLFCLVTGGDAIRNQRIKLARRLLNATEAPGTRQKQQRVRWHVRDGMTLSMNSSAHGLRSDGRVAVFLAAAAALFCGQWSIGQSTWHDHHYRVAIDRARCTRAWGCQCNLGTNRANTCAAVAHTQARCRSERRRLVNVNDDVVASVECDAARPFSLLFSASGDDSAAD